MRLVGPGREAQRLVLPYKTLRMREQAQEPVQFSDDVWAISAALGLCAFLWLLKVVLVVWYLLIKKVDPLADAPLLGIITLGGANLFVCAGLAVCYRLILALARRVSPVAGKLLRGPGLFLIHLGFVVFAVLSFEVSRIYGWPLDITHIRSADDPRIITASLLAYAGALPISLLAVGLLAQPTLLGRGIAHTLNRIRVLRTSARLWGTLATVTCVLFAGWFTQLRGINTYGIKDDALAYFITHYQRPFSPVDARQTMAELAADLGSARQGFDNPPSLIQPSGTIPRDFSPPSNPAAARGMNVLLIQMESTSAAYLDEKTTPNLTRLARHAISFTNHATVFSETSRASYAIYFSDYMTDLGTTPRLLYQRPLPRQSLAAVLKNAGYETAAIHSGFLSYADLRYLYEGTGFDTLIDATNLWSDEDELPWSWGVREEQTVDAIAKWLEKPREKPFFMLYATEFPHHPYTCPIDDQPYEPKNWLNRYRNSLHYADKCIGTLLNRMRDMNVLDNTVIVIVGDHGETVSTYPVGHGVAISREELFTPFIISNPKVFPSAEHSNLVTNHLDIAPTIVHLLGLTPPADWLGRDVFAPEIPARLLFMQAKLARVQAVLDNGVVSVWECARKRAKLYDISNGGFAPIQESDPRMALRAEYCQQNELFQKWAVWRHMARAAGNEDVQTASTPRAAAAQPAAATFERSSSAAP